MDYATRCKITPTMADYTSAVIQLCPFSNGMDGPPFWTAHYAVTAHPMEPEKLRLNIHLATRHKLGPGQDFVPVDSTHTIAMVKNIVRSLCEVYPHKELILDVVIFANTVEFKFKTHVNEIVREVTGYLPSVKTLDLKAQHNYG